jgi:hypothetical protein
MKNYAAVVDATGYEVRLYDLTKVTKKVTAAELIKETKEDNEDLELVFPLKVKWYDSPIGTVRKGRKNI